MEEQFETFDPSGRYLGIEARSIVHREGLWHRAANVFLFSPDGRLLIQRRQLTKDVWPGAWDLSAAEHLKPGETFLQGALRGLREELGIEAAILEPVGEVTRSCVEVPESAVKDCEFQQSFRGEYAGETRPEATEVMATALISLEDLAVGFEQRPGDYTPWFRRCAADCARLWDAKTD